MVSTSVLVARRIKVGLTGGFTTMPREEVTSLWRQVSGEPTARLGCRRAEELEQALLEQGVRCVPSLTSGARVVRLIHAGTLLGDIVDWVLHPSPDSDRQIARLVTKVKGRWTWPDERGQAPA